MTETLESVKAERDALALKLWRIVTGREEATVDDVLHDKRGIQEGVRALLLDVLADTLGVQIGNQVPDYFKDQIEGEFKRARMDVRVSDMLAGDVVRVEVTVSMDEQKMRMNIPKNALRDYVRFVQDTNQRRAMSATMQAAADYETSRRNFIR